jgi:hypothetical protein
MMMMMMMIKLYKLEPCNFFLEYYEWVLVIL